MKKAEKKGTSVSDTPEKEVDSEEKAVDRKTVRVFLADKYKSGKIFDVKNLIVQFGFQKELHAMQRKRNI